MHNKKSRSKQKYSTLPLFQSPNADMTNPSSFPESNYLSKPPQLQENPNHLDIDLNDSHLQGREQSVGSRRSSSANKKRQSKETSLMSGFVSQKDHNYDKLPKDYEHSNAQLLKGVSDDRLGSERQKSVGSKKGRKKPKENSLFNPESYTKNTMPIRSPEQQPQQRFRPVPQNHLTGFMAKPIPDKAPLNGPFNGLEEPAWQKGKTQQQIIPIYFGQEESTVKEVSLNSPRIGQKQPLKKQPDSLERGGFFNMGLGARVGQQAQPKQRIQPASGPSMNFMDIIKTENKPIVEPSPHTLPLRQDSNQKKQERKRKNNLKGLFEESRLNKSKQTKLSQLSRLSDSVEKSQRVRPKLGDLIKEKRMQDASRIQQSVNAQPKEVNSPVTTFNKGDSPILKYNQPPVSQPEVQPFPNNSNVRLIGDASRMTKTKIQIVNIQKKEVAADNDLSMSQSSHKYQFGVEDNKMSLLGYSRSPPKNQQQHIPSQIDNKSYAAKDSLCFSLESDPIPPKKKGLTVVSSKQPIAVQKPRQTFLERSEVQSQKSDSKNKHKKVKESTLELLTKPNDQKYFNFKVQDNSPNKPNDSFYADDSTPSPKRQQPILYVPEKPTVVRVGEPQSYKPPFLQNKPEPIPAPFVPQQKLKAAPQVITFEDDQNHQNGLPVQQIERQPFKTADNFYYPVPPVPALNRQGSNTFYEPSMTSSVSKKPPRPPSSKKSASSKASKDSSVMSLDSASRNSNDRGLLAHLNINKQRPSHTKKMTLNEIAEARKKNLKQPAFDDDTRSRKSTDSRKKESCLMNQLPANQGTMKKSIASSLSRDSSEQYDADLKYSERRSEASNASSAKKAKKQGSLLQLSKHRSTNQNKNYNAPPAFDLGGGRSERMSSNGMSFNQPVQRTSAQRKRQVLKRNCYHIDQNGRLSKGEVFIPLQRTDSEPADTAQDYFKSQYANPHSYRFSNDNASVGSRKSKKSRSRDKQKANILISTLSKQTISSGSSNHNFGSTSNLNRRPSNQQRQQRQQAMNNFINPQGSVSRVPTSYSRQSSSPTQEFNPNSRKNLHLNSLNQFIKSPKQSPNDVHLQAYYKAREEQRSESDYDEQEEQQVQVQRLNYNQMFARNNKNYNTKVERPVGQNYSYANQQRQVREQPHRKMRRTQR